MTSQINTVKGYFGQLGLNPQWIQTGSQPPAEYATISWNGVNMAPILGEQLLSLQLLVGYVPASGIAALYRRLLTDSSICKWTIAEPDNGINMIIHLATDGISLAQVKWMLDSIVGNFYQFGMAIQNEFQLPQQPT